ncbi:hypothetical protein COCOBI_01-7460 [Coccomyxa sp. Obi]|nr:hypothetical protein COCOBI_01-7460 [Coccomyxa sp. Obi]
MAITNTSADSLPHQDVNLAPTAGLRLLACLAVITCNVMWSVSLEAMDKPALHTAYAHHTWMGFILQPELPVYTFLVLTGFLAALSLLPALETTRSPANTVKGYFKNRILRIVPAYYIMLILLHGVVLPLSDLLTPDEAWRASYDAGATFDAEVCRSKKALANFLFQNNQLANGGCYNITWTLAVQMQLYLLLPLALLLLRPQRRGFRKGVAVASATIVACVVLYRAILLQNAPLWRYMPLPFFRPYDMVSARMMHSLAHRSFLSLGASLSPFCLGVLAAVAATSERCRQSLVRYRMWLSLAWTVLALCVLGACTVDRIGPTQDPDHPLANPIIFFAAFTIFQGFFLPLLPALTLLLTTMQLPGPPAVLARLLSHAACARLADISYEMYLVHSLVICEVLALFPPSTWFAVDNPVPFVLIACHVITVTAAAAWVLNRGVSAVAAYIGCRLRFSMTPSAAT